MNDKLFAFIQEYLSATQNVDEEYSLTYDEEKDEWLIGNQTDKINVRNYYYCFDCGEEIAQEGYEHDIMRHLKEKHKELFK